MRIFPDFTPNLLLVLLLAQLCVRSASRPAHFCARFGPTIRQMGRLKQLSRTLHGLNQNQLNDVEFVEYRLNHLPSMQYTAEHLSSMQLIETLSQLYLDIQAFKQHADWLKTAREKVSLPSQPAEAASHHLQQLSNLTSSALKQMGEDTPQPPSPSLPTVSDSFDVLKYAIEISDRLDVFCNWSTRVLKYLQTQHPCP